MIFEFKKDNYEAMKALKEYEENETKIRIKEKNLKKVKIFKKF